jgi:hypothetical protein
MALELAKPALSTQQFLPTSLRAAIVASSYWVVSLSLTVLSGSVGSFIGCLFACYLIDIGIQRRFFFLTSFNNQDNYYS